MNRSDSVNQTYARKYEKLYRTKPVSIVDIVHRFHSEEVCREYLEKLRWPDGVCCIRCGSCSVSEISTRDQFDCNDCRYRFSVTSGTVLDNTKLPLWKWFAAIFLMIEGKKGISANQLKRTLGVSYKTAWFLCHRIREAMRSMDADRLCGIIEVDETWVGGKAHGVGKGWGHRNKAVVIGAVEREGKIRLQVIAARDRQTLHAWIKKNVDDKIEVIYTDDWPPYVGNADDDTRHETVNHSAKEWVRGLVHTNTVENVWSLLKRSVIGSFHHVSKKHLERYLDELEFRFNNRKNPFMFRDALLRVLEKDALRYQELTA
jgi:transposase-like protein